MPPPPPKQRSGFSFERSDAGGLRLDDDDSSPFCKARDFTYQTAFLAGTKLNYRTGDRQNLATALSEDVTSTDVARSSESAFARVSNRARRGCGVVLANCHYYVFYCPFEMFEHLRRRLFRAPDDDTNRGSEVEAVATEH